jgi:hypothetical protein
MSTEVNEEHLGGVRSFTAPLGCELPLTDLLGLWGPQTRWRKATTATKVVTGCDSDEKGCQDGVRPRPLTHRKFDTTKGLPRGGAWTSTRKTGYH